ncbi:hypothetical protein Syun_007256 [Stephania yunnanensis]|uniref:Uncharacterized protein n=1 Tax=Stephania yunnanensis TaxID=152371 RepID=A0AAP0PZ81_9MAGN
MVLLFTNHFQYFHLPPNPFSPPSETIFTSPNPFHLQTHFLANPPPPPETLRDPPETLRDHRRTVRAPHSVRALAARARAARARRRPLRRAAALRARHALRALALSARLACACCRCEPGSPASRCEPPPAFCSAATPIARPACAHARPLARPCRARPARARAASLSATRRCAARHRSARAAVAAAAPATPRHSALLLRVHRTPRRRLSAVGSAPSPSAIWIPLHALRSGFKSYKRKVGFGFCLFSNPNMVMALAGNKEDLEDKRKVTTEDLDGTRTQIV